MKKYVIPKVSVIVLMHNITPWLLECSQWCIKSIREHTVYPGYELVIIDNASCANGYQDVNAQFVKDGAIVVRHEANLGMTGGYNSALEVASGEFLFFVENDVVVTNFWLTNALKCFADNPKAAIVKAVEDNELRDDNRRESKYNQEERYKQIQDSNPGWLRRYLNSAPHDLDNVEAFGIDAWTSLWCFGFRRSALRDIGGSLFDEEIGLNWDEDMDLIWRLRDAAWKTLICHSMYVYHRASQTCKLKGEYAASPEKEAGRRHFQKKHDLVYSEHGWATRRKLIPQGEALGHQYHEYGEDFEYGVSENAK
jgi:GT2 family glycosyltransferase